MASLQLGVGGGLRGASAFQERKPGVRSSSKLNGGEGTTRRALPKSLETRLARPGKDHVPARSCVPEKSG